MHENPAYGTLSPTSHAPEDTGPPAANTSATPPIYATISEKSSKKQSDAVGHGNILPEGGGGGGGVGDVEYQVVDDHSVIAYN